LRVIRPDGASIDWATAIIRYVGFIISGVIFLISLIIAGFDDERRALHDRLANIRIIMDR